MSLNQYSVIQQLGKPRKFSRIELAQTNQGGRVIFKSCKKKTVNSIPEERLRNEALFTFEQAGLPKVIELIESETELILVKEFVEGVDLLSYISSFPRRKRAKELGKCIEQLQPLLEHIHSNSIVHLDLKPSNILVNKKNNHLSISILDFGLATKNKHVENRKTLFPLGFAAPELILNRLHLVDHRTDYFALGICIWNCITGQLPLTHPNPSIMTNLQLNLPLSETSGINKKELIALNKLCFKHTFSKPPNTYSLDELDEILKTAIENRTHSLVDFIQEWNLLQSKKNWLGY